MSKAAKHGKANHIITASAASIAKPAKISSAMPSPSFLLPAATDLLLASSKYTESFTKRTQPATSVSSSFQVLPLAPPSSHVLYISSRASWSSPDPTNDTEDLIEDDERVIFIANLPADSTPDLLRSSISKAVRCPLEGVEVRWRPAGGASLPTVQTREDVTIPGVPHLFPVERVAIGRKATKPASAHVRLSSAAYADALLVLPNLPFSFTNSGKGGQTEEAYLGRLNARYEANRPGRQKVKDHADAWMAAWERQDGSIPALLASPSKVTASIEPADYEGDECGWTLVTRGGHHGRSFTLPTQTLALSSMLDPYAQSSMARKDSSAAVKVMKRGFAESFAIGEANGGQEVEDGKSKKRRGGQLVKGFYRFEKEDQRKAQKAELKKQFKADKAKVERMRQQRKFRPY